MIEQRRHALQAEHDGARRDRSGRGRVRSIGGGWQRAVGGGVIAMSCSVA